MAEETGQRTLWSLAQDLEWKPVPQTASRQQSLQLMLSQRWGLASVGQPLSLDARKQPHGQQYPDGPGRAAVCPPAWPLGESLYK